MADKPRPPTSPVPRSRRRPRWSVIAGASPRGSACSIVAAVPGPDAVADPRLAAPQRRPRRGRSGGTSTLDNFRGRADGETTCRPDAQLADPAPAGRRSLTVVARRSPAYPLSRYHLRFRRPFLLHDRCSRPACRSPRSWCRSTRLFVQFNLIDSIPARCCSWPRLVCRSRIWMMKNFMDGVPVSLEEAAWTDGAGWVQALRRIVLPLMAPGVAVVSIFMFVVPVGQLLRPVHPALTRTSSRRR